ncbi:MAG: chromosomal replication initiator protein DnaA [Clostridia bacterium]|nr:chromosomal replication initiator protein DnaA [Clostridia bacterium]MBR0026777.1 chromosomal replication initiator protein DnaA [Clostridia bacterium]
MATLAEKAAAIWEVALEQIRLNTTVVSFNAWFAGVKPFTIYNGKLILIAGNEFLRDNLENLYQETTEDAVGFACESQYGVKFIIDKDKDNYIVKEGVPDPRRSPFNPRYTFDKFIIGNSNNFAYAASLAVAEKPAESYNPLFIYGGVGLGKTHLMHAIGHYIAETRHDLNILYITCETFHNDLLEAIGQKTQAQFRNRYRNVDVLMIDDIQFLAGKEFAQEEMFHTFNALHGAAKQIVISSDRPPKEIPTLEDRLRTRFEWGLLVDVKPPDLETRYAILKNKADMDHYDVGPDVLMFIAENVRSNIRELEGCLNRVMAYANLKKLPASVELTREALADMLPGSVKKEVTVEHILKVVADYYSVSVENILSNRRGRDIVMPRQMAMFLCRDMLGLSFPDIGKAFGGKDHTTVMHAVNKVQAESENSSFYAIIEDLKSRVRD